MIRNMNDENEEEDEGSSEVDGGSRGLDGSISPNVKALNEIKRSIKFPKKVGGPSLVESEVISIGGDGGSGAKELEESVVIKTTYKPKLYRNRARQRSKRNNF